jgi:uncharacterized NAD(P)/FAD-binding protein YdhS
MKKVAIVGVGPTGIYTFHALVERGEPLEIELYEQAEQAGVGMPYNSDNNADFMLANIASIEIPPIYISYLTWLQNQSDDYLAQFRIERNSLHERQFLPRVILGDYYRDRLFAIVEKARGSGFAISINELSRSHRPARTRMGSLVDQSCFTACRGGLRRYRHRPSVA